MRDLMGKRSRKLPLREGFQESGSDADKTAGPGSDGECVKRGTWMM